MTDPRYDRLKTLIASTFPEIHWEVWAESDYERPPKVVRGGVDGWKYRKGVFQTEEGPHEEVINALIKRIRKWYFEDHPVRAAKIVVVDFFDKWMSP